MPMIAGIMPAIAVKAYGTEQQENKFGIYRAFGSLGFILGTMILPLIFNDIALTAQVSSVFMVISLFLLRRLPKPGPNRRDGSAAFKDFEPFDPMVFLRHVLHLPGGSGRAWILHCLRPGSWRQYATAGNLVGIVRNYSILFLAGDGDGY